VSGLSRLQRIVWMGGWPIRTTLTGAIKAYRLSIGNVVGGRCRFHPSCSVYAEEAIAELGAVRGTALAMWRLLRCSPLTAGGVDYPPRRSRSVVAYDADIQQSASPMP
jgi:putative membrane protein insertion efficiency factor